MTRTKKLWLLGIATSVAMAGVVVVAIWTLRALTKEGLEDARRGAREAGTHFAVYATQAECVSEAIRRAKVCTEVVACAADDQFVEWCLRLTTPDASVCKDVTASGGNIGLMRYSVKLCGGAGADDSCFIVAKGLHAYCAWIRH